MTVLEYENPGAKVMIPEAGGSRRIFDASAKDGAAVGRGVGAGRARATEAMIPRANAVF